MIRPNTPPPDHVSACVLSQDQVGQLGILARAARSVAVYDLLEYQALQPLDTTGCTFPALEAICGWQAFAWPQPLPTEDKVALREQCAIHVQLACSAIDGLRVLRWMRETDLEREAALCSRGFCLHDERAVECCMLVFRAGAAVAIARDGVFLMYGWRIESPGL